MCPAAKYMSMSMYGSFNTLCGAELSPVEIWGYKMVLKSRYNAAPMS